MDGGVSNEEIENPLCNTWPGFAKRWPAAHFPVHDHTKCHSNIFWIMRNLCTPRPIYRLTYRPTLDRSIGQHIDRCIGRHIDRHSADISTEICRSTYRPIYRQSVGRYVDRHLNDMLTESGCPIVGQHINQ